jgi:benzoyl-CoA reductase/2-hydroxyglutaryl-CoA dehydratase subunit BcrC/BadD/HgdB
MNAAQAERTIQLVVELTDVYVKVAYPQYNRRRRKSMELERMAKTSPEAQTIKYADIIDNCSEIVSHDRDFARVFLRECKALLEKMPDGDPELYRTARELVTVNLKGL